MRMKRVLKCMVSGIGAGLAKMLFHSFGMTFRGISVFQKMIRAGKDATCSWEGCAWVICGTHRTKCDWFQVETYANQHKYL
jgi:hypothetical protein